MMFSARIYLPIFISLLLTLFSHTALAAQHTPPATTFHLTGRVEFVTTEGGFFGIIGDDGQKYQPTNLPRKVRTNGLPIKFDARINDNIVSPFLWGTIIDVSNVTPLTSTIPPNERGAIYVFLKRMDAFNGKDLASLQKIDTLAKQLTSEQFTSWIGNYSNYTLQYVQLSSADSYALTGTCYYTREFIGGMRLEGNIELAATTFTISKTTTGWKLTELETLPIPTFTNRELLLTELKEKSLAKYNTHQLSTLLE